uniref:Uncharacterized protein n=1 Tax=Pipistrellus kuhlii TaxID=59472 RepID=A0A7J7VMD5_PIPKU|nr:hypothetical protein mPipKuh1_008395 [Pipistrellus kuhlii]
MCPQPRYTPLTGIEPGTFQSTGRSSIHWAKLVRVMGPSLLSSESKYLGITDHLYFMHNPLSSPSVRTTPSRTEAIKGLFYNPFSWWFVPYCQEKKKDKIFTLLIMLENVPFTTMSINHMNTI